MAGNGLSGPDQGVPSWEAVRELGGGEMGRGWAGKLLPWRWWLRVDLGLLRAIQQLWIN